MSVLVDCPPDTDPMDAVESAAVLAQYAAMHPSRFSKRHLRNIEMAHHLLNQVVEELD